MSEKGKKQQKTGKKGSQKEKKTSQKEKKTSQTQKKDDKGFKNIEGYKSKGKSFWDMISRKKKK